LPQGRLRAGELLLGSCCASSTVRYLDVEANDAIEIGEKTHFMSPSNCRVHTQRKGVEIDERCPTSASVARKQAWL
jgi:hypothetical protein